MPPYIATSIGFMPQRPMPRRIDSDGMGNMLELKIIVMNKPKVFRLAKFAISGSNI
jgi:hypothetical protein